MQQRGARIVGMAGALVVAGFGLIVETGDPGNGRGITIVYLIVAVAILLAPRRWAAWVATVSTVPTALLMLVGFANYLLDGLILLAATVAQGGAALALHRGAQEKDSSPTE